MSLLEKSLVSLNDEMQAYDGDQVDSEPIEEMVFNSQESVITDNGSRHTEKQNPVQEEDKIREEAHGNAEG